MAWSRPRPDSTQMVRRSSIFGSACCMAAFLRRVIRRRNSPGKERPARIPPSAAIIRVGRSASRSTAMAASAADRTTEAAPRDPLYRFSAPGLRKPASVNCWTTRCRSFSRLPILRPAATSMARRLSWSGLRFCDAGAEAARRRSIAAPGRIQYFIPKAIPSAAVAMKSRYVRAISISHLDGHNFPDDDIGNDLQSD